MIISHVVCTGANPRNGKIEQKLFRFDQSKPSLEIINRLIKFHNNLRGPIRTETIAWEIDGELHSTKELVELIKKQT